MNILKKTIAPVTDAAWKEIGEQADDIFKNSFSHRKFVDIEGPLGLDFGAVSTGRLVTPGNQKPTGVNYGVREVKPLIEVRKPFELNLWELDNSERGAKDLDLEPLEKAARQVAEFEEHAVYYGFKEAGIEGLADSSEHKIANMPTDPDSILKAVVDQVNVFGKHSVEGPYSLVLKDDLWYNMVSISAGYPVIKQIEEIIGGKIIIDHYIKDSFLISNRGKDFELTLGQDVSIGYDTHNTKSVKLYFTHSFTFRVLSPEAVIVFKTE